VLVDFPFVGEADRAHAVGLSLLPMCRDLIDGPTPLHLIEAPDAGSGKGLLAEVCLFPTIGHRVGTLSPGRNEEEWRKSITTVLRKGHDAIWIDNINRPLRSGDLAAALISPMWEDRVLGQSTAVRVPVRCTWLATANNPVLGEELTRHSVRIRIDPKVERPWLREGFHHETLREWVHTHRATLVWASLTLVRAWLAAGRPHPDVKPLGSYESWSHTIGGILQVASIGGFLGNLSEFYDAATTEASAWHAFVVAWWKNHQCALVTAKELLPLALEFDELEVNGKDERGQVRSLGRKLGQQRDRVIGAYRLITGSQDRNSTGRWRLEPVT
jgi:putative DNA primase/helicase